MESFPGFSIDEIAARRFAKLTGEVNLPPIRFSELGTPSLFHELCSAGHFRRRNGDAGARPRPATIMPTSGAQLDFNFTVALRLPMVFSVGAAGGWRDGHYRKTEWLASLKIM